MRAAAAERPGKSAAADETAWPGGYKKKNPLRSLSPRFEPSSPTYKESLSGAQGSSPDRVKFGIIQTNSQYQMYKKTNFH